MHSEGPAEKEIHCSDTRPGIDSGPRCRLQHDPLGRCRGTGTGTIQIDIFAMKV
jgi:hypothetical protein